MVVNWKGTETVRLMKQSLELQNNHQDKKVHITKLF